MSFFAENWILILIAFVSGGMLVWPLVQRGAGGAMAVGTAEAVRLINRERGVLIDVAEPGEFAQAHARGARNVPFGQIEGSKDLPSNKALPVILVCPSGARAGRAAALLRKAGWERAVAVSGGTRAWAEASLPVARGEDKPADKSEKSEKAEKGEKAAVKSGSRGKRRDKAGRAEPAGVDATLSEAPAGAAGVEPGSTPELAAPPAAAPEAASASAPEPTPGRP